MRKRLSELSSSAKSRYLKTLKIDITDSTLPSNIAPVRTSSQQIYEELSVDQSMLQPHAVINSTETPILSLSSASERIFVEPHEYENIINIDENVSHDNDHDSTSNNSVTTDEESCDDSSELADISSESSDDEENSDEECNAINNKVNDDDFYNQPLYADSSLTVEQSMMLIQTLVLNHKLTDTCVEDLFTVIRLHCPQNDLKIINLYRLHKFFEQASGLTTKKYYCSQCHSSLANNSRVCTHCGNEPKVEYFLNLSINDQIRKIMKRPENYEILNVSRKRKKVHMDYIEDFYDGSLYRTYWKFLKDPKNISLTWCSDGVAVFKSSKISVWPFYLRINELPYGRRILRKNTILAGLWFGNKKPSPHIFTESFAKELDDLYSGIYLTGANVNNSIIIKGLLISGTSDLPAKSLFLNISQFNGTFGCPNCEYETVPTELPSGTSIRVYKYLKNYTRRTLENMVENARKALQQKPMKSDRDPVVGVKGPCALMNMMPDYIQGMAIDSMHAIYEGVVKKLLTLWFDASYSECQFSIRSMINVVDEYLLKMKPPKFIHRMPKSVETYTSWKASELKNWFFYYSSIILVEIMKPEYMRHYMLLISSISLLNADIVSKKDVKEANTLLHKFVEQFEIYYGLRYCSINVHQLLHLADNVEKFGPLWTHSCFPFENINGELMKLVHGTKNVDSQIVDSHWEFLIYTSAISNLPDGSIKDFTMKRKKQVAINESIGNFHVVGQYSKMDNIPTVIQELLNEFDCTSVRKYFRLLKSEQLYVAEMYKRQIQTDSCGVLWKSENLQYFGKIMYFIKISNCKCEHNICHCHGKHFAIIQSLGLEGYFSMDNIDLKYLHKCFLISNHIIAVPIEAFITVCFKLEVKNNLYVAKPVNLIEKE